MPDPIRPRPATAHRPISAEADELMASASRLLQEHNVKVLNAVADGVYVLDAAGNTIFANDAAAHLLGYSIREMLGVPQHDLIHYAYADGSDFPKEECPIYLTVTEGVYQRVGGDVFWKKDGTPLPVDYTSSPIRAGRTLLGAVITFRDISEHQKVQEQQARLASERAAREEARQARLLLERVFEQAPAAMSMTEGAEHRIVAANALARELAGRTIMGRTVREAFPELEGDRVVALLDQVFRTGEPVALRDIALRWHRGDAMADGRFDITYQPVRDDEGRVTGVLTLSAPR